MSEVTDVAESLANEAGDEGAISQEQAQAAEQAGEVETTDASEVASVLKGSGMKVEAPAETEEEPEAEPETPEEPAPLDEETPPEEPAKPAEPETPVDATPEDAPSFTLEVEDANGEKYTITSIEDLPEDFEPKNNRQIMEILDQTRDLKVQKAEYETAQAAEAEETARQERVAAIQQGWDKEFADLKITDKAEQDKVYAYMKEENARRAEAGKPLLSSIEDARNGLTLKEQAAQAEQAKKDAKETARRNGSLVGGSSAPAGGSTPVYRAGQAKNATEALRQMGTLR